MSEKGLHRIVLHSNDRLDTTFPHALRIWLHLCWRGGGENSGGCYQSQEQIADELDIELSSVKRWMKKFQDGGRLQYTRNKDGRWVWLPLRFGCENATKDNGSGGKNATKQEGHGCENATSPVAKTPPSLVAKTPPITRTGTRTLTKGDLAEFRGKRDERKLGPLMASLQANVFIRPNGPSTARQLEAFHEEGFHLASTETETADHRILQAMGGDRKAFTRLINLSRSALEQRLIGDD